MRRQLQKLSAKAVEKQHQAGYFSDGGGLYLQVSATHSKSWIFRYTLRAKPREMGLGSLNAVSLADARKRAATYRSLLADGIDPIEARDAANAQEVLKKAKAVSFSHCAESFVTAHGAKWKNAKHASQWTNTLKTYCAPFNMLPVQSVDTAFVLKALEPIWTEKAETATRLRARIEAVIDWATVRGHRAGENPARWRGHLDKLLPALKKKSRVKHHPALPYEKTGAFIETLRAEAGTAARALEFTILTCARTGEAIAAKPDEFDLKKALWTIPASRMKAGREHRVPLSARAVEIVRAQMATENNYVFPGMRAGTPLSNMAMLMLLKRMKRDDLTVHGFRSSFRDWASEQTNYPREVAEMALAHTVSDQVEAAYRRGDLFEKRRRLMADWAKFCSQKPKSGKVVPIRKAS